MPHERSIGDGVFFDAVKMDLFGNPLKSGILPFTIKPYYLRQGKMSEDEFQKACSELKPLDKIRDFTQILMEEYARSCSPGEKLRTNL